MYYKPKIGIVLALMISVMSLYAKEKPKKLEIKGPDLHPFGIGSYTCQNKNEGIQAPQVIPMGMLSAYCTFKVGDINPTVCKVIKGGISDEAKMLVGDIIISINGNKLKDKFTADDFDGGRGPQEALGYGIEEALGTSGKIMTMEVLRAGKVFNLAIKMPDLEPYGPNYPFDDEGLDYANLPLGGSPNGENQGKEGDKVKLREKPKKGSKPTKADIKRRKYKDGQPVPCERSARMMEALTNKILEIKGPRLNIGGQVQSGMAGMALLSTWNLDLLPHIKDFADGMRGNTGAVGGLPAWGLNYGTSFLCEYYLATLDKSILPEIEARMIISEDWTHPSGKHGHGKDVGYKHLFPPEGSGINIITSQHFMNFGLALLCGVDKVPPEKIMAVANHLRRSRSGRGSVGYICPCSGLEASGITGKTALGFQFLSEYNPSTKSASEVGSSGFKHPSYAEFHKDALLCAAFSSPTPEDPDHERYRCMRNSHANSSFAMYWGCAAAATLRHSKTDGGYRRILDYWRWYYSLGEAPEGSSVVRYFIPSKGNTGGDMYLGYDTYNHIFTLFVYGTGKQGLHVHGNKTVNWFNKEALLRKQGKWEKVKKLMAEIDKLEKEKNYRKAYYKVLELKTIDETHEYVFRKPRDWTVLANNEINITLPIITSRDFYRSDIRLRFITDRYGDVIAPRSKFFYDKVLQSEFACKQIKDGKQIPVILDRLDRKQYKPEKAIAEFEKIQKKYISTGFEKTCQDHIDKIRTDYNLPPPKEDTI